MQWRDNGSGQGIESINRFNSAGQVPISVPRQAKGAPVPIPHFDNFKNSMTHMKF
ncbi:hypothetical protein [Burkholderia glumae]|uniref:hypothetical protein n=1 Tax=Burkholderia glumae TaxID=337 RepID=UPI0002E59FC9|nr:hypothetical protein [Burkholderia glumae]MCM2495486.1 hypothetical protein [Burkholderia glumae]MCM2546489.1 hypothetical protein [Burkholderia glumae]MCM2552177.1 hypothetical protein [Burkholderia glumae]NVE24855.1 hypothetical protein [Burkholderia glumae]QJP70521.1 hypothetical protein HJC54_09740 [Burkholderia glumae]